MKVRCPVCGREVNAPKDVIAAHKRRGHYLHPCEGAGRDALSIAIERLAQSIDARARWVEEQRAQAAAIIARADSENAVLDVDRSKLAALRKRLDKRAKDGAR